MKKIIIATILSIGITSCNNNRNINRIDTSINSVDTKKVTYLGEFPYNERPDVLATVTIDGCEYIVANAFPNKDITLTHKGNCQFCIERQKIFTREILSILNDSIK